MSVNSDTVSVVDGRKIAPATWAWAQRPAKPLDKAALWSIAHHTANQSLSCWLKLRTIAEEASANTKKIDPTREAVKRLAVGGFVATLPLKFSTTGSDTVCLYILNVEGWLNECSSPGEVLKLMQARVQAMAGEAAMDLFPSRYEVSTNSNGLRLPSMYIKNG